MTSNDRDDQPIRLLYDQDCETRDDFVERVRRKIHRRSASAQVASFSWFVPRVFLKEMIELIGYLVTALAGGKGR